jgi:dTDP-4-amino-4,6-dideoxygalactose transaminase
LIYVTKPYLPERQKLNKYIDTIYQSGWLTNNGPLVQKLENRLTAHLGVKYVILTANGTNALQIALKSLNTMGEVITTPFSFIATSQAIDFIGMKPIFSDIHKHSLNLDPTACEKKITENTQAILPVHVYGNPCEVEKFNALSEKYNIPVIYDAAHCFDVKYKENSILNYGKMSVISFHATKLFHCVEGGAIITNDDETALMVRQIVNFGFNANLDIVSTGTNAKMNEFEAAMGLAILDDIDYILKKRSNIWDKYHKELSGFVRFQSRAESSTNNFSYAPIIFKNEALLKKVMQALAQEDIYPRRYFYPCLNVNEDADSTPIAKNISNRILCLPIYPSLEMKYVEKIISIIRITIGQNLPSASDEPYV